MVDPPPLAAPDGTDWTDGKRCRWHSGFLSLRSFQLRKRFYIMLVARNSEGELLKIPIPLHYVYVFIAGALIGMLTITGMAGSYTRMLVKARRVNQLRDEKDALKKQYSQLEQIAAEN